MPWVFLLLSIGAFAIAFRTSSVALVVVCLLAGLGFLGAWLLTLLAQRVGTRSRHEAMMVDPMELKRLREQADARRAAAAQEPPAAS